MQRWGDADQLRPVAEAWLRKQAAEVSRLVDGVCVRETWDDSVPADSAQCSGSASEVIRIFNASLATVSELDIPLHGSVMRAELDLIGSGVRCRTHELVLHVHNHHLQAI